MLGSHSQQKKDRFSVALKLLKPSLYGATTPPHYSSPLRTRSTNISGGDLTTTFNVWTISSFVLCEALSSSRIWSQSLHQIQEQLCLCVNPPNPGTGSPVITACSDTHHWLSIRAYVSGDLWQHRNFKKLLTDSVISTWLVTILFKDPHPTQNRLPHASGTWPQIQKQEPPLHIDRVVTIKTEKQTSDYTWTEILNCSA